MQGWQPGRRAVLAGAASLWPALAFGQTAPKRPADPSGPPIVFVHGNGDSAALWINNIWRFETNGFKRGLLHAIDLPWPNARADDSKEQQYRSSTDDQMKELAAYVAQVRKTTRQSRTSSTSSPAVSSAKGAARAEND